MNHRLPYPTRPGIRRSRSRMVKITKRYNFNGLLVWDVKCVHCKWKSLDHSHNGAHMAAARHRRDKALVLTHGATKIAS